MEQIVKYDIAYAKTASELATNVNAQIMKGWQPFGNIASITRTIEKKEIPEDEIILMQPIVKYI